ncbi:reverse transcriptase domain-containing protein [Caballeronia sp. BR00000012568055]|uniref:reverse transcriptase domain-containing protein n=1 Tax=Caballeronia sp. BR00000012568055 TaxID=2918761 RepID=UPI0034D5C087
MQSGDRKPGIPWARIRSCFDEISHDWLIAHIPMDTAILLKWLKAGYLHNHVFHETKAGSPQGGIISPTLMNMTLDGLERMLLSRFRKHVRNAPRSISFGMQTTSL